MSPEAAVGLGLGAIQAGAGLFGLGKKKKAAEDAFNAMETYSESPYTKANLKQSEQMAQSGMPGMTQAKQDVGETAAQAISSAKGRRGGLETVGTAVGQKQKALQGLATKGAEFRQRGQQALMGARTAMTGERAKAFQSRSQKQQLRYQQSLADLAGQKEMISQGVSGMASALAGGKAKQPMTGLTGLFGKKKGQQELDANGNPVGPIMPEDPNKGKVV